MLGVKLMAWDIMRAELVDLNENLLEALRACISAKIASQAAERAANRSVDFRWVLQVWAQITLWGGIVGSGNEWDQLDTGSGGSGHNE